MLAGLEKILSEALAALAGVQGEAALEQWRTVYLGRNSDLMKSLKQLGALDDAPKRRQLRWTVGLAR